MLRVRARAITVPIRQIQPRRGAGRQSDHRLHLCAGRSARFAGGMRMNAATLIEAGTPRKRATPWQRFAKNKLAVAGVIVIVFITAAALFQPALKTTIIVIGLSSWPGAARATGASSPRILARQLLPQLAGGDHHPGDDLALLRDSARSQPQLSRFGREDPDAKLGEHASGWPARVAGRRRVTDRLPRRRDLSDRALLQLDGRRTAGRA